MGFMVQVGSIVTDVWKCYIHPAVIDAYLERPVTRAFKKRAEAELVKKLPGLRPEEAAVLALLQKRLSRELEAPR
jgi:DNA topoisomerase I